jgi:hypothetical protein
MLKGNKGEWSEYYTFLKLLVEGRLHFGGPQFEKIENKFYPVMNILRTEGGERKSYELCADGRVKIMIKKEEVSIVDISDLKEKVKEIFRVIVSDSETTFSIKEADPFIERLQTIALNAGSQSKEDLTLQIHDDVTGADPEIGFSIKSMAGSAATLLNASGPTNFIYKIHGLAKSEIKVVNSIETKSKIRDRLVAIKKAGGLVTYVKMESDIFMHNLRLCDTIMPEIVAQMLLIYYAGIANTFEGLVDKLVFNNITFAGFEIDRIGYEHRIQNLLYAVALGMTPNKEWDGLTRAHGGYIIVREDGELIAYNLYNLDTFKKYLLRNTKFETASSTRHGFGTIYEEGDKLFIKLNLQIRFIA